MTAMELLFGIQIDPETVTTITLNDVNLKTKVKELKRKAAKRCNLSNDTLELIYCGLILEDDATIESSGLRNGSLVYALPKKESESPVPFKYIPEDSILQLTSAFKSFNETPAFRSALHRLSKRPEVIDNIISSSPGLHEDSVAIAMLQDPDLMAHFTDIDTVKRIAELHPVLIEAAQNIAAAVHEEAHNAASSGSSSSMASSQATARSYSVDNLSLEEEMARDIANFFSTHPMNDNLRFPDPSANNSQASSQRTENPASSTSTGAGGGANQSATANQSTGVVTPQMFMEAMRQVALATANPAAQAASSPVASLSPILPPISPQTTDLQRQLAQMHEMGLQDDMLNVQALQFTNGDVQAAIELVFSGFGDN
ncbi:ubiquitin-like protein 7 isoform X1 [Harpegnathos saltator]|uniref:ubiquitin-like protein 7 isoform X1 n=1 Tax=Harpegnathos saltator TaxID=610380 RepID=UPI00058F0DCB|nr:ubiquitin-like protein 7 isoform X1 [Harpegnathos saltator]XP_025153445.1 ubiquitin-like protein 7 isoform X1 [Harpegnathos saltator]XP_025153447.1 ubiquitin-like protein 7 isoform X1 [Harpegnathos saltator]